MSGQITRMELEPSVLKTKLIDYKCLHMRSHVIGQMVGSMTCDLLLNCVKPYV